MGGCCWAWGMGTAGMLGGAHACGAQMRSSQLVPCNGLDLCSSACLSCAAQRLLVDVAAAAPQLLAQVGPVHVASWGENAGLGAGRSWCEPRQPALLFGQQRSGRDTLSPALPALLSAPRLLSRARPEPRRAWTRSPIYLKQTIRCWPSVAPRSWRVPASSWWRPAEQLRRRYQQRCANKPRVPWLARVPASA